MARAKKTDAPASMSIEDLFSVDKHEAGAECQIRNESGELTPLRILVRGMDSKAYREDSRMHRRKVLEAMSNGKLDDLDEDALEIDTLVALTIGWNECGGPFTPERCRELYTKAPYVRDQVDRFIGKRANFTKG